MLGMTQHEPLENREAESLPKGLDLGVSRKLVYWSGEIWVSEGKALVMLLESALALEMKSEIRV